MQHFALSAKGGSCAEDESAEHLSSPELLSRRDKRRLAGGNTTGLVRITHGARRGAPNERHSMMLTSEKESQLPASAARVP